MKSGIFTKAFTVASFFLLISCSKDDGGKEFCWDCKIKTITRVPSYPEMNDATSSTIQQCGMTEEQISEVEENGTSTVTSSSGGVSVTISSTTSCSKR